MITLIDIKKSVNGMLRKKYGHAIYGKDVKENLKKPSFYTELLMVKTEEESVNFSNNEYTIKITYLQQENKEEDNLIKIDEIRRMLGSKLKINNTLVPIKKFNYDFIGVNEDILQISFNIEFLEWKSKKEYAIARELQLNKEWRK